MPEFKPVKQMARIIGKFVGFREMIDGEPLDKYLDDMEGFSPVIDLSFKKPAKKAAKKADANKDL
jgi:hypothetical protein